MGLVGRVGEVHRLEADGIATDVGLALLADQVALVSVGRIDLHGGFGGIDLHGEACFAVVEPCHGSTEQGFVAAPVAAASSLAGVLVLTQVVAELVAMVVAARHAQLEVVVVDAVADGPGLVEVEWRVGYGTELAIDALVLVVEGDAVAVDPECFVEHIAAQIAREVEERVVAGIEDRGLGGCGPVVDAQGIGQQGVGDIEGEFAGETVLAVGRDVTHGHGGVGGCGDVPIATSEVGVAAVSAVAAALLLQFVGSTVDLEMTADDAPDVATHDSPEVLASIDIIAEFVVAEDHVGAECLEANDACPVVDGCHFESGGRMAKRYWLDFVLCLDERGSYQQGDACEEQTEGGEHI